MNNRLNKAINQAINFNNIRELERYIIGYILNQMLVKVEIRKFGKKAIISFVE